jgi:hypothetical protein
MAEALSSLWDGLSPHLIASFWEVNREGKRQDENVTVAAPLLEANFEASMTWQSPFENVGQSSLPTLQQLLQSGTLEPLIKLLPDGIASKLSSAASTVEGKTSVTKLNSTQVFSGMPPAKVQVTALFRAWKDPVKEVENPLDQLMKWALPVHLDGDSLFLSRLGTKGASVDTPFPSSVPVMVAMKYKGRTYKPLVIESIGVPISSPIDGNGKFVEIAVPLSLATLTAIDRNDWVNYSRPQTGKPQ